MKLSKLSDRLVGQPMFEMKKRIPPGTFRFEIGDSQARPDYRILLAAINSIYDGYTKYTDSSGIPQLKDLIAIKYGFNLDAITILPANSAIDFIVRCLCCTSDDVIIISPHFPTYSSVLKYNGIPFREFHSTSDITIQINTKLIILNSPCNPTGKIIPKEEFLRIYELAEELDFYILADEAYIDMYYGDKPFSLAGQPRVITIRSYSKAFSMAGFRVGYCVAPPILTKKLGLMFQTIFSCLPHFTQVGAIAAETYKEEIMKERMAVLERKRDLMVQELDRSPLFCPYPQGGIYCFPDISATEMNGDQFSDLLLENGVSVLPGSCFGSGLDKYVRLCFDTDEETIKQGMEIIRNVCNQRV